MSDETLSQLADLIDDADDALLRAIRLLRQQPNFNLTIERRLRSAIAELAKAAESITDAMPHA